MATFYVKTQECRQYTCTYEVEAESKTEAKRLVEFGLHDDPELEEIDTEYDALQSCQVVAVDEGVKDEVAT